MAGLIAAGAIDVGIACGVESMSWIALRAAVGNGENGMPRPDDWAVDLPDQFTAADRIAELTAQQREARLVAAAAAATSAAAAAAQAGRLQLLAEIDTRTGAVAETEAQALHAAAAHSTARAEAEAPEPDRAEGTNTGHENGEAMASVGVRVEPTVRLGSVVEGRRS